MDRRSTLESFGAHRRDVDEMRHRSSARKTGTPLANSPLTRTWSGAVTASISPVSATRAVLRRVAKDR